MAPQPTRAAGPRDTSRPGDGAAGARIAAVAVWSLLVLSLLAWRQQEYYTGGVDPVVAAKAAMSLLAVAIAAIAAATRPVRHDLGAGTVVLVVAYLATSLLGAWAMGEPGSSLVLTVRVVLVAGAVALLVIGYEVRELAVTFLGTLTGIGLVLAVTGVPTLWQEGRLGGGLIPLNPNQLALLLGLPTVALAWSAVSGRARAGTLPLLVVLVATAVLTGSRTGLIGLLLAALVLVCLASTLRPAVVITGLLAVPAVFYLVTASPWVADYFGRDGTGRIDTLNSRTIAWEAAFSGPQDVWERWFGGGLAIKTVAVTGTHWENQVLDSSWVSGFVQAGRLGVVILVVWVLLTAVRAALVPRPWLSLAVASLCYVLIRSLLGNGLLDAHILFVMWVGIALVLEARPRAREESPPSGTS